MTDLASLNEIEVSVIGTGGGYGESIVIHLGKNNWIIIDSCRDPKTKKILPLELLKNKGIDIKNDLKLLICTHWDDDHIIGISEILQEAESALFCMPRASDRTKFLKLVGLDYHKIKNETTISSLSEIGKCLDIIHSRNGSVKQLSQDILLLSVFEEAYICHVYSLSPSDLVVEEFDNEISTLITEFGGSDKKLTFNRPNEKSSVIFIRVNNHNILLGSDLEVNSNRRKGWYCIVDNSQSIKGAKCSLYKISHHGSKNGFDLDVWNTLLEKNVFAGITPWNHGKKLPTDEMLKTFMLQTNNLFITSYGNFKLGPKKRPTNISTVVSRFNRTLNEVKYKQGIVQFKSNIDSIGSDWNVELFGEAVRVG